MADATGHLTNEELLQRLATMGHPVPTKGKLNDAKLQILRKKLNHLEARERMSRTMVEKKSPKRAREKNDTTVTPNKRRRTLAVVSASVSPVKFADSNVGIVKDELVSPMVSELCHFLKAKSSWRKMH